MRAHAFDQLNGALGVDRAFHIHSQKIVVVRSALHDGNNQAFAEFGAEVEAELSELAGDVGVQAFVGDAVKNFEVSVASALRVFLGRNIFAQIIEAGEHTEIVALAGSGDSFVKSFTWDKTVRHAARAVVGNDPMSKRFAFGKF